MLVRFRHDRCSLAFSSLPTHRIAPDNPDASPRASGREGKRPSLGGDGTAAARLVWGLMSTKRKEPSSLCKTGLCRCCRCPRDLALVSQMQWRSLQSVGLAQPARRCSQISVDLSRAALGRGKSIRKGTWGALALFRLIGLRSSNLKCPRRFRPRAVAPARAAPFSATTRQSEQSRASIPTRRVEDGRSTCPAFDCCYRTRGSRQGRHMSAYNYCEETCNLYSP